MSVETESQMLPVDAAFSEGDPLRSAPDAGGTGLVTGTGITELRWPSADEIHPPVQLDAAQRVIDGIDNTLELIAEATEAARNPQPLESVDVSIIVPVFNERETLPEVLERIEEVMPPRTEVIIVDDASDDGTAHWLRGRESMPNQTVIRRRVNHGKGSAVRLGIRHCRGRVIVIQDADMEYDPADLLRVVWPILDGRADVVYGSRFLGDNHDAWWHRFGNWLLTTTSNLVTGLRLTDMETCHKAFRADLLKSISIQETRFGFEPEITAKIASRNCRVLEVPSGYEARGFDEGKKIGWRDAIAAFACIWRYRKSR